MGKRKGSRTSERSRRNRKARRAEGAAKATPRTSRLMDGREAHIPTLEPDPTNTHPPVFVWPDGRRGPGPHAVLGLPEDATQAQVDAAFRAAMLAHPPEQEPDLARRIREAREVLRAPEHVLRRYAGRLRIPDADAWGLAPPEAEPERLSDQDRLLGLAALYALAEHEVG